jgi:putative NIF3 family GTP cyclohydrolase 1 type 2
MPKLQRVNKEARHLVLIDIENLAATPSPSIQEVRMVMSALRDVVPQYDDAQCVVACSHHAARTVAFAFPAGRRLWRSGRNGADLALAEVLENERVDERFGRVTICSGNGIFASSAARLARANVDVTVVSLEGHMAARLQLAARTVVFLAFPTSIISTGSAS